MDPDRAVRSLSAALVLVALLGGCSVVGDIRRPAPARDSAPAATPPPGPAQMEVRQVEVPVPRDYSLHTAEFVDQRRGYALFTHCGLSGPGGTTSCEARLLATVDGGVSWRQLTHPHPVAVNHQLYATDTRIALLADPYGWWVSPDVGATFTHVPGGADVPPAYRSIFGRYQVEGYRRDARLVLVVGAKATPLATQPPVPWLSAVAEDPNALYAAGLDAGRPYAAVSRDDGRTWRRTPVPAPPEPLVNARLLVSVGHNADAWLVGDTNRTRFPMIWRYDGTGWQAVAATGHPDRYFSVAAAGEGVLLFSGPSGSGVVVDGAYRVSDWPVAHADLRRLADGTLLGRVGEDIYLGIGNGLQRRWISVVLTRL